jgi:hypothetical protein
MPVRSFQSTPYVPQSCGLFHHFKPSSSLFAIHTSHPGRHQPNKRFNNNILEHGKQDCASDWGVGGRFQENLTGDCMTSRHSILIAFSTWHTCFSFLFQLVQHYTQHNMKSVREEN